MRQLCWRDFHHQLMKAEPRIAHEDQHGHRGSWRDDPDALAAWKEGSTGEPLVDAGNWQWVAGTGADTRPYRKLNPERQAARFDAEGEYQRRWLGELPQAEPRLF